MVPRYGPGWRYKIVKFAAIFWKITGAYDWHPIKVAPHNRKRRPGKYRPIHQ